MADQPLTLSSFNRLLQLLLLVLLLVSSSQFIHFTVCYRCKQVVISARSYSCICTIIMVSFYHFWLTIEFCVFCVPCCMFSVNVKFSVPLLCVYVCILLERPSPK